MIALIITMLFPSISFAQAGFTLLSSDLGGQLSETQVLNGFGCKGENISPALRWENPPQGTKSFAVTVYDPDAPTGSGWWHWLVFDISPKTKGLAAGSGNPETGAVPAGSIQSITSFGTVGYGGACPPEGDRPHRYIFTVYALKVEQLGLKSDASPAMVGFYLGANSLAKASLIAYYGR